MDSSPPARQTAKSEPSGSLDDLKAMGYSGWDPIVGAQREASVVDREAAPWAGQRIYADDRSRVYAVEPSGAVTELFDLPHRTQLEFARPLQGGRMLTVSVDEGIDLVEPSGELAWSTELAAHHEAVVVPRPGDRPGERLFAVAVHGDRELAGRRVRFDSVVFIEEASGTPTESADFPTWKSWEHREALDALASASPHPLSLPRGKPAGAPGERGAVYDYFHLNGLAFNGPDEMVVCLRNVSLVAACELPSGAPRWSLRQGLLDWPHAPSVVRSGEGRTEVLVFDNGAHRGRSRVLRVDPTDSSIAFEWSGTTERPLWSRVRGFVEALPGGHLLITESERGRCLEIDHDGTVVWEFLNPEVRPAKGNSPPSRRRIYRMTARPF